MIRIDLTTHAVIVEGDGNFDHFITVRTLQTAGSASRVDRYLENEPRGASREVTETARSRSGRNVMREYDIDEPGVYALTSGRREMEQNRTFYIRMEFIDNETMQVTVLPPSFARVQWIVEDDLHDYQNNETFSFRVRISHAGVAQAEGEVTRIESDVTGIKFERPTAWERLLDDDDSDSV